MTGSFGLADLLQRIDLSYCPPLNEPGGAALREGMPMTAKTLSVAVAVAVAVLANFYGALLACLIVI